METVFYNLLKISAWSGIGILLVLAVSPLFKKRYTVFWRYFLWIFLAVRLVLPFDVSIDGRALQIPVFSGFDLDNKQMVSANKTADGSFFARSERNGKKADGTAETKNYEQKYDAELTAEQTEMDRRPVLFLEREEPEFGEIAAEIAVTWLPFFWLGGMAAFLAWQVVCYGIFCRNIKKSKVFLTKKGGLSVYKSCSISSPMLFGMKKPEILIPCKEYGEEQLAYILEHEFVHYKKKDLWLKLLMAAARTIHWFNPLVMVMAKQMEKDMEFLCDSHVVKNFSKEEKKKYSETLLTCASHNCGRNAFLCVSEFSRDVKTLKERFGNIFAGEGRKKGILASALGVLALLFVSFLVAFGSSGEENSESKRETVETKEESNLQQETALKEKLDRLTGLSVKDAAKAPYGAVFPRLVYASEERAVWYDYRSLMVYDLKNEKIDQLLDLKAADLAYIQGDQTTHIEVSNDGQQILLYNEPKTRERFIYYVDERRLSYTDLDTFDQNHFDGLVDTVDQNYVSMESGKTAYLSADSLWTEDYEVFHETDLLGLSLVVGENSRGDAQIYPLFMEYFTEQEKQAVYVPKWKELRRLVGREFLYEDQEGWQYYLEDGSLDQEIEWPHEALHLVRQKGEERQILENLITQDTWKECPVLFVGGRIVYKAAKSGNTVDLKAPVLVSIAMDGSDRRTADDVMYNVFDGLCEDGGWLYYSGWTNDSGSQKPLCRISPDFSGGAEFVEEIPGLLCGIKDGFVFYLASHESGKSYGIWKRNMADGKEELVDKWGISAEEISYFNAREEEGFGCHLIYSPVSEAGRYETADVRF